MYNFNLKILNNFEAKLISLISHLSSHTILLAVGILKSLYRYLEFCRGMRDLKCVKNV